MITPYSNTISVTTLPYTGLLDDYPNASAAYSLRLLRSDYTGDAIRVRRSSDNAETDIGFDSNGELDTTALLAHVGTSPTDNGFIETWYDQSGSGRDATQTTTSQQPQIVSSGSVITDNGKPAIKSDGNNDILSTTTYSIPSNISVFCIYASDEVPQTDTYASVCGQLDSIYSNNDGWSIGDAVGVMRLTYNSRSLTILSILEGSSYNLNQRLNSFTQSNSSVSFYLNNNLVGSNSNLIFQANKQINLFAQSPTLNFFNGKVKEFILYPSDQSSNRTGIETNINDFYSIYP